MARQTNGSAVAWDPVAPRALPARVVGAGGAQVLLLPQACTWGAVVQPTGQTRGRVAVLEGHGVAVEGLRRQTPTAV